MHVALLAALLFQVKTSTPAADDRDPAPPYAGVEYVDLDTVARRYQVTWTSEAATGREVLRGDRITVVLAPSLDTALVNGVPQKLPRPVVLADGRVRVPAELARLVDGSAAARRIETRTNVKPPKKKWFTIVLDPGHGGMHTGGRGGTGVVEKQLTLDLAFRLRPLLEEEGGTVILTRTDDRHFDDDVHRDLQHRVNVVNGARPDAFLSIHVNWVPSPDPRGFEIWVRKGDRGSRDLAASVRAELNRAAGTEDRGIKDDRALYVLRNTSCPAALVEVGFISNVAEESRLCDPAHRQRLAVALAEAVKKYLAGRR
ncbi:MAG: N-acetylmuramoyl-L-alanine amidase [Planctomycetes bacterium]|nr:N-acetylmuramoyl-L-alanine amidase [Planctomycetota bacterium]